MFGGGLFKGGPGSGDKNHLGRRGLRGGSARASAVPFSHVSGKEIAGSTPEELRAAAIAYVRANFRQHVPNAKFPSYVAVKNTETGRDIRMSMEGINHALKAEFPPEAAQIIPALPDMLRNATVIERNPADPPSQNVKAAWILAAPVKIGAHPYAARLVVRETTSGDLYYHHDMLGLVRDAAGVDAGISGAQSGYSPDETGGGVDVATLRDVFKRWERLGKALEPGERWITIRPPGHDKGQPVLVKPTGDGAMKIIGGAGGKLNHLRLTDVKSPEAYAHEVRQKAALRKDARKRQLEEDNIPREEERSTLSACSIAQ